jgi:hypothetical protein
MLTTVKLRAQSGTFPLGALLGGLTLAVGSAVGLLHLDHLPITLCMFKSVTGLPCGTCGTTRALGRLVHLDVPGALALNPLMTLGAAVVLLWAAADLILLARGRSLQLDVSGVETRWLGILLALAFLVNWAYLVAVGR